MQNIQRINATKARNDFFNLLKKSYLENKTFLIEKGEIPMVYMIPVDFSVKKDSPTFEQDQQLILLKKINKFRNSMKQKGDSVRLIRQIRRYGR